MTLTRTIPDEDPPPYTPTDPLTPSSSTTASTTAAGPEGPGGRGGPGGEAPLDLAPLYSRTVAPPNFVSAAGYFFERPPPPPPSLSFDGNDEDGDEDGVVVEEGGQAKDGRRGADDNDGGRPAILEHALTIYTRSKAKDYARFPRCWRELSNEITEHDWATFLRYLFPAHLGLASSQNQALPAQVRAEIARDNKDAPQETDEERRDRIAAVVSEWNDCFFVPRGAAVIYCYGSSQAAAPVSPLCPRCYPAASGARSTGPNEPNDTGSGRRSPLPARQQRGPPIGTRASTDGLLVVERERAEEMDAEKEAVEENNNNERAQAAETPRADAYSSAPRKPSAAWSRALGFVDAVSSFQQWASYMANQAQQYGDRLGEQAASRGRMLEDHAEMFGRMAAQRAHMHGDMLQEHAKRVERKYKDMGREARERYQRGPVSDAGYPGGDAAGGSGGGGWWNMSTSTLGQSNNNAWQRQQQQHRERRDSVSSLASTESSSSNESLSSLSSGSEHAWDRDAIENFRHEVRTLQNQHLAHRRRPRGRQRRNDDNDDGAGGDNDGADIDAEAARLRQELFALRDASRHLRAASTAAYCSHRGGSGGKGKQTREQKRAMRQEVRDAKREYRTLARQMREDMKRARQAQKQRRKEERQARLQARKGKNKQTTPTPTAMGLDGDIEAARAELSSGAPHTMAASSAEKSRAQSEHHAEALPELETGIVHININDQQGDERSVSGPSNSKTNNNNSSSSSATTPQPIPTVSLTPHSSASVPAAAPPVLTPPDLSAPAAPGAPPPPGNGPFPFSPARGLLQHFVQARGAAPGRGGGEAGWGPWAGGGQHVCGPPRGWGQGPMGRGHRGRGRGQRGQGLGYSGRRGWGW